jgi:ribosomal protein L40E
LRVRESADELAAMSAPAPDSLSTESATGEVCRMCDAALPSDARVCPRCGYRVRRQTIDGDTPRVIDVVLAVVMVFLALVVTTLPTLHTARGMLSTGFVTTMMPEVLIVGVWNLIVLGCPVLFISRRWLARVRRGQFEHAVLLRDYWFLQAMALVPTLVLGAWLFWLWI